MTRSERAFWILLGAGLWNDPNLAAQAGTLTQDEWAQVVQMSINTGTSGLLCESLMFLPLAQRPANNISARAAIQKTELLNAHRKHNAVLCDIVHILRQCGAKPVLMKGQGVALEYNMPQSRACGDIDIYVSGKDLQAIIGELQSRNIALEITDIDEDSDVASFVYRDLHVELHRHAARLYMPKNNARFQLWWERELQRSDECLYVTYDGELSRTSKEGSERVDLPNISQNSFYLFYHVYHHFMSPYVQFRQFCDLARFLYNRKDFIDSVKLKNVLDDFGMMRAWKVFGCFLNFYMNMPADRIPFYDQSYEGKAHWVAKRLSRKFLRKGANLPQKRKARGKFIKYLNCYADAINVFPIFPGDCLQYLKHIHIVGIQRIFRH